MKFYGVVAPTEKATSVHLDEDLPELLALGDRGEALVVFGVKEKLQSFVQAHHSLRADSSTPVRLILLGTDFFELAQTISAATRAGIIERVVFDPVLDDSGVWVKQSMDWSAQSLCRYFLNIQPVVLDMARRAEGLPADSWPSQEAVDTALSEHMLRSAIFLTAEKLVSRGYHRLGRILLRVLQLVPTKSHGRSRWKRRPR